MLPHQECHHLDQYCHRGTHVFVNPIHLDRLAIVQELLYGHGREAPVRRRHNHLIVVAMIDDLVPPNPTLGLLGDFY